ncbi:MAG: hypothetical protein IPM69_04480 [Ignavibacteria bacterium]|nr:hypothetical protein [Ignavibacteria bacterium]
MILNEIQTLLQSARQAEEDKRFSDAEQLIIQLLDILHHDSAPPPSPLFDTNYSLTTTKEYLSYSPQIYKLAGSIYYHLSDFSKSLQYQIIALDLWEQFNDDISAIEQLISIAALYSHDVLDPNKAEEYLLRALEMCIEIHSKKLESQIHERLADLYIDQQEWSKFAEHFRRYVLVKDEVQAEEARELALRYEREKENARLEATETLLYRMLPPTIVTRMMNGETKIADHHESISILFADIVGFTPIATNMSASSLLAFMNMLFERYDEIALKYGCERIKTIGDGYLAICGAPVFAEDHVLRITNMALEMLKYAKNSDHQSELPEGMEFLVRIGLHCGPIVAGVIGTGKISYDIYGDSVNIAARMESHSEPSKIHVSKEFRDQFLQLYPDTSLTFIDRGTLEIKGKGMMNTFYVERMSSIS